MNGTDWPSPAATLSVVEQQIKKILAATGVDVPSLALGKFLMRTNAVLYIYIYIYIYFIRTSGNYFPTFINFIELVFGFYTSFLEIKTKVKIRKPSQPLEWRLKKCSPIDLNKGGW